MKLHDARHKAENQEILRQGMIGSFWSLMCEAMEESTRKLEEDLDSEDLGDLPADMNKVESEILKAKKKNLQKLFDMPQTLIDFLEEPPKVGMEEFDPYEKPPIEDDAQ